MPVVEPARLRRPVLVPMRDRAADNLRFIRETMERAGSFTALPGWGVAGMGVSALAAGGIASWQPTPPRWLAPGGGGGVVAAAASLTRGRVTATHKARGAPLPLFSGPGRKFALSFAPPLLVGG